MEAISLTTHIYIVGHPRLRQTVALKYWEEKNYHSARQHFLFLAVEKGQSAIGQFARLLELYKPSLDRDPTLLLYLDKIGQLYFGLPPKKSSGIEAMFGDFMQAFLGSDSPAEGV